MFAGAGLLIGGALIAANKQKEIEVEDEDRLEQTPGTRKEMEDTVGDMPSSSFAKKKIRSKVNLLELEGENTKGNIGAKVRSRHNLLELDKRASGGARKAKGVVR